MVSKLATVDLDGTVVEYDKDEFGSSWGAVLNAAGFSEERKKLTDEYFDKKELYKKWFKKQVALLKGKSLYKIKDEVLPPKYSRGARKLFEELRRMGLYRGIITSGVDIVARYVEKDLDLDFCVCNDLFHKNGFFTGLGKSNVDLWKKGSNLIEVCKKFNVKPSEAVVIGDHENELDLFEIAGLSIAYKPKTEKVKKSADYVITNLNEIPLIIKNL